MRIVTTVVFTTVACGGWIGSGLFVADNELARAERTSSGSRSGWAAAPGGWRGNAGVWGGNAGAWGGNPGRWTGGGSNWIVPGPSGNSGTHPWTIPNTVPPLRIPQQPQYPQVYVPSN